MKNVIKIKNKLPIDEVYKEVGNNYRYFLDWRYKLLSGYIIIVSSLASYYSWVSGKESLHTSIWIFPVLGVLLTILVWTLAYRTRKLYQTCQKVGKEIENAFGVDSNQGIYSELYEGMDKQKGVSKKERNRIWSTHNVILNIFFSLMLVLFIVLTIICLK